MVMRGDAHETLGNILFYIEPQVDYSSVSRPRPFSIASTPPPLISIADFVGVHKSSNQNLDSVHIDSMSLDLSRQARTSVSPLILNPGSATGDRECFCMHTYSMCVGMYTSL